jgi:hypothetical protein
VRRTERLFTDEAKERGEEKLKKLKDQREAQLRGYQHYQELRARERGKLPPPLTTEEAAELTQLRADAAQAAVDRGVTSLRNPNKFFKRNVRDLDAQIKPLEQNVQKLTDDQWARLQAGRIVSVSWLAGYYDLSDFGGTGDFFGSRLLNYGDSWLPRRGLLQKTRGIWEPLPVESGASIKDRDQNGNEITIRATHRQDGTLVARDAGGNITNMQALKDEYKVWQKETGGYFMLNPKTPDFFTRLLDEAQLPQQNSDQDLLNEQTTDIGKRIMTKNLVPQAWFAQRKVDPSIRGQRVSNTRWEDPKLWQAFRRKATPDRASVMDEPAFAIPEQIFQSDQVDEITAAEATRKIFWSAQSFFHNPTMEKFKETNVLFKHISEFGRQDKGWGDLLHRTLEWMDKDPQAKELMEELDHFPKLEAFRWIEEASGDEMITNEMRDKYLKEYVGNIPGMKARNAALWIVNADIIRGLWSHPMMVSARISDTLKKIWNTLIAQTIGEDIGAKK